MDSEELSSWMAYFRVIGTPGELRDDYRMARICQSIIAQYSKNTVRISELIPYDDSFKVEETNKQKNSRIFNSFKIAAKLSQMGKNKKSNKIVKKKKGLFNREK